MICFKSIGSSVLAMSLVFGDKVIMLDLSKWHKSNRYGFLTHRQKWHSLNRNAWHNETEITGTNRTEVTNTFWAIITLSNYWPVLEFEQQSWCLSDYSVHHANLQYPIYNP